MRLIKSLPGVKGCVGHWLASEKSMTKRTLFSMPSGFFDYKGSGLEWCTLSQSLHNYTGPGLGQNAGLGEF